MSNKSVFEREKLSLWLKDGNKQSFSSLNEDISCDVLIVGAGIVGITTAYILSDLGFNIVLIDKKTPMNLTTGNTTAKFTVQHDIIYSNIIENYGLEKAQLYYQAQREAQEFVQNLISKNNIQCDYKETYSILYAETKEQFIEIEQEYEAYKKLDIPCELVTVIPYGIDGVGGLKIWNQFVLNPSKYLSFLIDEIIKKGVKIYQDTNAVDTIINDDYKTVVTQAGHGIQAKNWL